MFLHVINFFFEIFSCNILVKVIQRSIHMTNNPSSVIQKTPGQRMKRKQTKLKTEYDEWICWKCVVCQQMNFSHKLWHHHHPPRRHATSSSQPNGVQFEANQVSQGYCLFWRYTSFTTTVYCCNIYEYIKLATHSLTVFL